MALGTPTQTEANQILQPQSASTALGVSGTSVVETINQNGLSLGYTNGITDFNTYLASNPTRVFFGSWISSETLPGSITFDLGSVFDLDGMVMWGTAGFLSAQKFELFASVTGDPSSFTSLGSFLQDFEFNTDKAQVFDFGSTMAQFIRMDIVDNYNTGGNRVGIGEVAFRGAEATPETVPEPMTIFGSVVALGVGALLSKKTAKKQEHQA